MRLLILLSLLPLAACGPDVAAWKGTYSGSASLNAGRQPEAFVGTLTITDDARFTLTTTSSPVWTCALTAQSVTATAAVFQVPTTCALGVTPSDNCTHTLTINAASVTRDVNAIDGSVSGRVNSACPGASTSISDFLLQFSGMR